MSQEETTKSLSLFSGIFLKQPIHKHFISAVMNPRRVRSRARAGSCEKGKGNLPALTQSTDPQPRTDGIQFQSTASLVARYGPAAARGGSYFSGLH